MARIAEVELERLKSQIDLVELVQSKGIELKKHGSDLVGHCPFHDDRTPSLVVTASKNLWHCMGACQIGGSVIDWVMKCEGVSFRHAVEILRSGDMTNVLSPSIGPKIATVPKLAPAVELDADDHMMMDQVIGYYHETLKTSPEALAYLESRGIGNREAIEKFRLGFANRTLGLRIPDSNREAGATLRARLQRLGLYRDTGREHFNGSIVIPVIGIDGRITEVYGRKITPNLRTGTPQHTYLPGPHQGIWNPESLSSPELILCESLIDALSFWVHGFKNVTASYGVEGFTKDHLTALLQHQVKKVFIAYDRDEAGDQAAERLSKKLLIEGIETLRVQFPRSMDANSFICKVKPAEQSLKLCLQTAAWMGRVKRTEALQAKESETASPSLAAAVLSSSSVPEVVPGREKEEEPAAKKEKDCEIPAGSGVDNTVELRGEDVLIRMGSREYRVRGLKKNLSFEVLRVNIRVAVGEKFFIDTLDLYQAKARTHYVTASSKDLDLPEEILKRDLGQVLFKLESLQEKELQNTLTGKSAKKEVQLSATEKEEALTLLKSPHLIQTILADFDRAGVIGEEVNKLVGYLASVSRKLDDPLAVVIQSSSAAGKSSLMEAVLAMVPEEDKVKYSAMTGQSLFYMGEKDLKHKILAIAEEQGAHQASYALKLLQSEGEISIASTGKDAATGRLVTHQYRVEGPVMIFLTTTAIEIDEELLNRCVVLTVNETREQTKAIHGLQRRGQTLGGLLLKQERSHVLKLHQNAQRLLRPLLVVNPFAEKLTFLDHQTRTRRDHMKYLALIRTTALLHQHQRQSHWTTHRGKAIEYIEVERRDIEIANELCHQVLGRSLDELSPQTRKLLTLLSELVQEVCLREKIDRNEYRFTRRDLRERIGWSDFQVQVHINKLVSLEYVLVHRGGRGQSFVYELLFDPEHIKSGQLVLMGLIHPDELSSELTQSFEHEKEGTEGATSSGRALIEGASQSLKSIDRSECPGSLTRIHQNQSQGDVSLTDAVTESSGRTNKTGVSS